MKADNGILSGLVGGLVFQSFICKSTTEKDVLGGQAYWANSILEDPMHDRVAVVYCSFPASPYDSTAKTTRKSPVVVILCGKIKLATRILSGHKNRTEWAKAIEDLHDKTKCALKRSSQEVDLIEHESCLKE